MKRPMVAFLTQLLLAVRSRFTRRARLEAEAAATFLTSDEASYVSGMTLVVDAGVTG